MFPKSVLKEYASLILAALSFGVFFLLIWILSGF